MTQESNLEFIKNIVDVKVDGLKGVNHYTIKGMYNEIHKREDGSTWATITHKVVDEFDYPWSDIERDGGIGAINRDLKETYSLD